ncbi:hypothetical protein Ato02nite_098270 [Paractinoplanes toevensis]|uniref:Uncharacterized protein n=1 Tax=Paractinoplanes toevensis TaxID=571911 RepID=A0A919WD30_9ACTN|nr:DUF2255 family protein [Actinoplanes toevensis]GIM98034.1 hypothetical protein Ato02nite_098270 [Actinoplanes toevensis]
MTFSPDPGPAEAIDAAYRTKYGTEAALVTSSPAREATLRIRPADTTSPAGTH